MSRIFLLSPAHCGGLRAQMVLSERASFDLAQRARKVKRAERGRMGLLPRVFPPGADDYLIAC